MENKFPLNYYPTPEHRRAAEAITGFFSEVHDVRAVLLTCSCARGKASGDSCLDIAVLLPAHCPTESKQAAIDAWNREHASNPFYSLLRGKGAYTHIDMEFIDGVFEEGGHHWTSGPDGFEPAIGNFVAYAVPLYTRDETFTALHSRWLPYYNEAMRSRRLSMVKEYCRNNLRHIPLYAERGLYFQCFNRLYHAIGEFLQALFITRRVYPIAYDKWIKEQLCDLLGLPEVYATLVGLMEYTRFESGEHREKADVIENLLQRYCDPPS